jgi:hypothetical protein
MRRLLITAKVVPTSPILVTLIMEALRSPEKSVPTRTTRRNIQEDVILQFQLPVLQTNTILRNKICTIQ